MRHSETIDNLSDAKRLIDELEEENAALRQEQAVMMEAVKQSIFIGFEMAKHAIRADGLNREGEHGRTKKLQR